MGSRLYRTISWSRSNDTGLLMLNTPPSNTMSFLFFNEFKDWIGNPETFSGLKAVIIRGAGRHFSSGADLDSLLSEIERISPDIPEEDRETPIPDFLIEHYQLFLTLERLPIPVIAAISGVCIGSAFELTLFCDYRICSNDAVLGLPETTFGLIPGLGGIQHFARLAGKAKAIEFVLRGCTFQASEAMEMGLVDRVVLRKDILPSCHELIHHLPERYDRSLRDLALANYRRLTANAEGAAVNVTQRRNTKI